MTGISAVFFLSAGAALPPPWLSPWPLELCASPCESCSSFASPEANSDPWADLGEPPNILKPAKSKTASMTMTTAMRAGVLLRNPPPFFVSAGGAASLVGAAPFSSDFLSGLSDIGPRGWARSVGGEADKVIFVYRQRRARNVEEQ